MASGGKRKGAGRKPGPMPKTKAVREKLQKDAELTAAATIEQIRRGAFYDIRSLFDKDGNLKPLHQLSESEAAPIAGVEVVKRNMTAGDGQVDTIIKVKLVDRSRYVEMAAKHHGLLIEQIKHSGGLTILHEAVD